MMERNTASIYAAGLLQGIALVAFPAASTIITGPDAYGFSSTEYGSLFIPQAIFSIAAAAMNPVICRRFTSKEVFLGGLTFNLFSMSLLAASALFMGYHMVAYALLIIATSCLGLGFGMVVPTINRLAEEFYPVKSDTAVLTLNALLGVGTALAPVFIALFSAIGFWWGLPFFMSIFLFALILYSYPLPFPQEERLEISEREKAPKIPGLFWVFAAFAFLYGIIETLNGNWVSIYMSSHLDAPIKVQSLALTSFWGMVTFGRVFFAAISKVMSEQTAFQIAPFLSTVAFVLIATLTSGQEYWAVIAFGLTGFGCSILLPLIISFGGKQLRGLASAVPGMIISSYLLGYGVAAFGVGPLEDFGNVSLRADYAIGAAISFVLGLLSLYIVRCKTNENNGGLR